MALLYSDLLDANSAGLRINGQNTALFATIGPLDHFYQVAFSNALHVFLRSNKRCECIEQGAHQVKAPEGLIAHFPV